MFDVKKANVAKTKVQQKILDISKNEKFMLLNLVTGVGKTLASLKIAQYHNNLKWLILCKEVNHIDVWKEEIKKHKIKIKFEIICYASLHKIKGNYNIICDEAHAITLSKRKLIIKNIKFNRIIFLTATLPDNKYNHLEILSKKGELKILTLDLNKAIKLDILPIPEINIIKVKMTSDQLKKYKLIDNQVKQKSFNYNDQKTTKNYESLMFIANKRKEIVANFKVNIVKNLVKQFNKKGTRFICFCNNIKQLDIIRNNSNYYIHSKRTEKNINQIVIEDFNAKKSNHIFTVKMLTESANLNAIEKGILSQLDKEPLTFNQRLGRVLRANVPQIYIPIVKDTIDEYYLENSLLMIDKKYIKYYER